MADDEVFEFEVTPAEEGQRLDRILVQRLPGVGRKGASELVGRGDVRVDGRRAVKAEQPAAGARVTVRLPEGAAAVPEPGPLDVLLERADLVVVDKPAGQPSAVLRGTDRGTLVNALLARYPEMAHVGFGEREPGLLHRLDTQTSGVLVAARHAEAFTALRSALESGTLHKTYLAVVEAERIDEGGVVSEWLGPHPRNRRKVVVYPADAPGARPARSQYRVLERSGRWALVEVSAPRAYRHQVRVHLASLGAPIAGDLLYGGADVGLGERHALHASSVSHTGHVPEPFSVSSPLPADLVGLLRQGSTVVG